MPLVYTRGFRTPLHRTDHFLNHGAALGLVDEQEYEEFADRFLQLVCPATALQFVRRRNGDLVRYDQVADVFGIKSRDGYVRTCYTPDPIVHGCSSNMEYYLNEEANN
jgi:pyocin large subunit-like protein